jgi:nickel/cobalt exporter
VSKFPSASAVFSALLLALGLILWTGAAEAQTTSPFTGEAATTAEAAPASGGLFRDLRHGLFALQRDVNRGLNQRLVAIKRGEDRGALWAGILFAFLYGVLHALGPGHGKSVVIGYFLGREARPGRGLAMAAWIAISHVVGAIVIVGLAHLLLSRVLASPTNEYFWLRLLSYAAILVIGLLMLRDWWRGGHHHHGHDHHHDHSCGCGAGMMAGKPLEQRALAIAAGFVPCSGAILILLFAMANHLILAGIAMAAAIAVGMGLALAGLGVGSIFLRRQVVLRLPEGSRWTRGLGLLGPLFVILVGAGLLLLGLTGPSAL